MDAEGETYNILPDSLECHDTIQWMSLTDCERAGYLSQQKFWSEHPTSHLPGKPAETRTKEFFRNDLVTCALLVCFVLVIYVYHTSHKLLREQFKDFIFPLRQQKGADNIDNLLHPSFIMTILMVVVSTLMCFIFLNEDLYYTYTTHTQPLILFAAIFVFWLLYFLLLHVLRLIVNWIFFSAKQRKLWSLQQSFVTVAEGMLFFISLLTMFFMEFSFINMFLMLMFSVAISKMALVYKAKQIFFVQRYGYFHLFLYLCALEIAPLLVAMKFVVNISEQLTTL